MSVSQSVFDYKSPPTTPRSVRDLKVGDVVQHIPSGYMGDISDIQIRRKALTPHGKYPSKVEVECTITVQFTEDTYIPFVSHSTNPHHELRTVNKK
jgi:hypothetical protein